MLRWRLILGVLFVACLAGLLWLDHIVQPRGLFLMPVCVGLCVLATAEVLSLLGGSGIRAPRGAVHAGALLPVLVVAADPYLELFAAGGTRILNSTGPLLGPALLLGVVICGVAAIRRFDGTRQSAVDLAGSVFAVTYIGGGLAVLALLRLVDAQGAADRGLVLLAATVAIVKSGDIGAYTVGRLIGRHKLAPRLSPGKTWEGAAGAVLFSCAAGLALFLAVRPENATTQQNVVHLGGWLLASAALAVAGMIGDLLESLLKRSAGVKDSSTWLPGFGGVLDVLDSLLLAAPVAFWLAAVGLVHL